MRIILAYKAHAEGATDPFTSLLPVGLPAMNAVLRASGHASRLANLSAMDTDSAVSLVTAEDPDLLGLSLFTHNRHETLELAARVKEILPTCRVILGGPHATHRWHELLSSFPFVDGIVIGEGEATILELAAASDAYPAGLASVPGLAMLRSGIPFLTPRREPMKDLDALPLPGRFMDDAIGVDPRRQLEFIITSRGCPARCRFCSSPGFWGQRIRFRSPDAMIEEIRYLRDHFGLIYFSIRDDTFTADRRRVIDFCRKLLAERIFILWNCQSRVNAVDAEILAWMKRAGCECIQLGIESGSPKILEILGKRITPEQVLAAGAAVRGVGLNLSVYLITGVPGESEGDIRETCRLVSGLRPSGGHVSPLVYYPGTALFEDAASSGKVRSDLFEASREPACQVCPERTVSRNSTRLMAALEKGADLSGYTAADFARQKELLGYCHVTSLLAGESLLEKGEVEAAEREYREIADREPDNPWGWLALGEMYGDLGELDSAIHSFEQLSALVPHHLPAYKALGELYGMTGDRKRAKANRDRARLLEIGNR